MPLLKWSLLSSCMRSPACWTVDTEVPELERMDPALGEKAEQLRMAANRSAAKGKSRL